MITSNQVRARGGLSLVKMAGPEDTGTPGPAQQGSTWASAAPRAVAVAALVLIVLWVKALGGVAAHKDVAADGSISTDRCGGVYTVGPF